jgi:hypothetical protein
LAAFITNIAESDFRYTQARSGPSYRAGRGLLIGRIVLQK